MAAGRVLRSGAAAALAVAVAALAHLGAGGTLDAAGAGWALAALAAPAWWLAGRERGWTVLAVSQLVGQQAAHAALAGPGNPHLSHVHGPLPTDLMLHAHLAAAACCALWLRWGERRAWAAVRAVVQVVLLAVAGLRVPPAPAPLRPGATVPARPVVLLRHALARRGPPSVAC